MRAVLYSLLIILWWHVAGLHTIQAQSAQADYTGMVLAVQPPKKSDKLTQDQLAKLQTRVINLLTHKGVGTTGDLTPFIITPAVEVYDVSVAEGMRNLFVVDADFSLTVGQKSGEVFSQTSHRIRGSGRNEEQAITNVINRIPQVVSNIDGMLKEASEKIKQYYEQNCDIILNEVISLKNTDRYERALARLTSIPAYAQACHAKAQGLMLEAYTAKLNRDCKRYLTIAQNAVALRDYRLAAEAMMYIHPNSECYAETATLKADIKAATQDFYDKSWAFTDKLVDNYTDILKTKYSNEGQNSFVIVSPSAHPQEVVAVAENRITICGTLNNPEEGGKLTIDGLVTSWNADGTFQRTLTLSDTRKTVEVEFENQAGQKESKTITLARDESKKAPENNVRPKTGPQKKVALVIGNGAYAGNNALANPTHDATRMKETLQSLGFHVKVLLNGDEQGMKSYIKEFVNEAVQADIALFYYAGHGVEIAGENYLVPVFPAGEALDNDKLAAKSINISRVVSTAMGKQDSKTMNLIILDACRSNLELSRAWNQSDPTRGLTAMRPPGGTLIAYATSPGATASDGTNGNGLYTGELIKQMSVSQRLVDVFNNTRQEVRKKSNGAQVPWEESCLNGVFVI